MGSIPLLKIVIAGDGNVGKTSLVRQYCEGHFEASRIMTIGVDFQTKLVPLEAGPVKLSIWDMAGQDRFQSVRAGFYRGSLAAALVYDLTDIDSLKNLVKWYMEIVKTVPGQKFVVVGNKLDLARAAVDRTGEQFARVIKSQHIYTSAATGEGVADLFEAMAKAALTRTHLSPTE
jgi:small GTP-binding protein